MTIEAMKEPVITVNGHRLTHGQAMAVRVAVGNFYDDVSDPDEARLLGEIGPLYQDRLAEVLDMMHQATRW